MVAIATAYRALAIFLEFKEPLNKSIYDLAKGFLRQARKMARRRSSATSSDI